jgi:signal transduction histidine kinase
MPLLDFIRTHRPEIIDEFAAFAQTLTPAAVAMTAVELRDHAHELLTAIVADMGDVQTADEQARKAQGRGRKHAMAPSGQLHADARIAHRFDATQLMAEFRALRASVLRLYADHGGEVDLHGVERFNEAIDEALTVSMERFSDRMDAYRDQFIGMLSHDLRAPLSAITAGAALLATGGDVESPRVASRILRSAQRMTRLITDLLDFTRTRLGGGIPIVRRPSDLQQICQDVTREIQEAHPDAQVDCTVDGDLRGEWDPDRLTQVVANLVGNAIQHGTHTGARLVIRGEADAVRLAVHNEGRPIPPAMQASIFEPLTRFQPAEEGGATSIGLGLFIARAIVVAHGGTITVSSSRADGTTFDVTLPRRAPLRRESHVPAQPPGEGDAP